MNQSVPSSLLKDVFLTGSRFVGTSDELGMQDHGTYMYPDGTLYVGEFKDNRFHGEGYFKLPDPESVCFMVTHRHGRLTSIDHIEFNDHLKVDFEMKEDRTIGFKPWMYCTPSDRRFHGEITGTLEPVGPESFKTKDGPIAPNLGRNIFDLGFGHLSKQGFMLGTKTFANQSFYLGCRGVRRWIRENCRHGVLMHHHLKQKIKARFAREIIQNNLEDAGCSPKPCLPPSRICQRSASLDSSRSQKSTRVHLASTTDSCSSKVELRQKRPKQVCRKKCRRSKSESGVCRLN